MKAKFVSESFARKWYNIGRQYQGKGTLRNCIEQAAYDEFVADCWEEVAAFRAGWSANNFAFEIKEWKRYGEIPIGPDGYAERSINHADNQPEHGVSVTCPEWENSVAGQWYLGIGKAREAITFTGLQVGYGSDGEPVVLPVEKA